MNNEKFNLSTHVHRRLNPLSGEWVLVSPHRNLRPWQGQTETQVSPTGIAYDPDCFLCPGNTRAAGIRNPSYDGTYVFDNDFAALRTDTPAGRHDDGPLLQARSERGICRVLCFSPRHDLGIGELPTAQVRAVIDAWAAQYTQLGSEPGINSVQIFENRGAIMGASNPHPHGQIWANETVPPVLATELSAQRMHMSRHGDCLLCRYVEQELRLGERLVLANDEFVALVPFWATWPFETLVLPKSHASSIAVLDDRARNALADVLRRLTGLYDRLFSCAFPYTAGWHQQPTDGGEHASFHVHAHFYPPLLRSATVRKFMVGYEMLAGAQRDVTPETAAAMLRTL